MITELFEADNHSRNVNITTTATIDQTELVRYICNNEYSFELNQLSELALVEGYNINSFNFKVGEYFLKILTKKQYSAKVDHFPRLVEEMGRHGVPGIEFIKNKSGDYVTKVFFKGEIFYATLQPFLSGNFYTGSKRSLVNMIKIIQRIEDAFHNIKPEPCHLLPYGSFKPKHRLNKINKAYIEKTKKNENDQYDNSYHEIFINLLGMCDFFESVEVDLDKQHIRHFDLHPHNLLFDGDEVAAVLDLDNIAIVDKRIATGFNLYKLGCKAISNNMITLLEFKEIVKKHFEFDDLKNFALIELLHRFLLVLESHYLEKSNIRDSDFFKYVISLDEINVMFSE